MARINVEDEWFSDPRRERFAILLSKKNNESLDEGYLRADGMSIRIWHFAQKYWFKKELIPLHAWNGAGFDDLFFECGLAEKKDDGIYVRGSKRHFEWYFEKCEKLKERASLGGKARQAAAKRDQSGRFEAKNIQPTPAESQLTSSPTSPSSSSSSSSSKTKNAHSEKCAAEISEKSETKTQVFDFESLYKKYPRKKGKKRGLESCFRQIKTQESFGQLSLAIDNYILECRREKTKETYMKYFSSFMSCWQDFVEIETRQKQTVGGFEKI